MAAILAGLFVWLSSLFGLRSGARIFLAGHPDKPPRDHKASPTSCAVCEIFPAVFVLFRTSLVGAAGGLPSGSSHSRGPTVKKKKKGEKKTQIVAKFCKKKINWTPRVGTPGWELPGSALQGCPEKRENSFEVAKFCLNKMKFQDFL